MALTEIPTFSLHPEVALDELLAGPAADAADGRHVVFAHALTLTEKITRARDLESLATLSERRLRERKNDDSRFACARVGSAGDPEPLGRGNDVLNRPFLPADIDTAGGLIDRWIFVETDAIASFARVEADWVASIDWPGLEGIVAHVEMAGGDIEHQLDDLQGDARLLVGGAAVARRTAPPSSISSPEFLPPTCARSASAASPSMRASLARAGRRSSGPPRDAPTRASVLDHLGKPPVLEGLEGAQGSAWRRGIEHLAALPNAFVKCSGMPAEAGEAFDEVAGTFDRVALDAFGADRAMFGGDWPVSGSEGFRGAARARHRRAARRFQRRGVGAARGRHGPRVLSPQYIGCLTPFEW